MKKLIGKLKLKHNRKKIYKAGMTSILIAAATIWMLYFILYLFGKYTPDSFDIGFSMLMTCLYFLLLIKREVKPA